MSTQVPVIPGSNAPDLVNAIAGSQVNPTKGGGDVNYLTFEAKRSGDWLIGKDKESCSGEKVVIDLTSVRHGYHRWHQKKLTDVMVPPTSPLPEPPPPIEWTDNNGRPQVSESNEARLVQGKFLDEVEDDNAPKFEFATSTYGGRQAFDSWWTEVVLRAQSGNPFMFPVIELGSDSYDHPDYGKTFTPTMEVVMWVDAEGNVEGEKLEAPAEAAEETPEEVAEEAPKKPRRRRRGS